MYRCIAVRQGDANAAIPLHCLVCSAVQLPAQALDAVCLLSIRTRKQSLQSLQSSAGRVLCQHNDDHHDHSDCKIESVTQTLRLGELPELLLNIACSTWQGLEGRSSFLLRVEG